MMSILHCILQDIKGSVSHSCRTFTSLHCILWSHYLFHEEYYPFVQGCTHCIDLTDSLQWTIHLEISCGFTTITVHDGDHNILCSDQHLGQSRCGQYKREKEMELSYVKEIALVIATELPA